MDQPIGTPAAKRRMTVTLTTSDTPVREPASPPDLSGQRKQQRKRQSSLPPPKRAKGSDIATQHTLLSYGFERTTPTANDLSEPALQTRPEASPTNLKTPALTIPNAADDTSVERVSPARSRPSGAQQRRTATQQGRVASGVLVKLASGDSVFMRGWLLTEPVHALEEHLRLTMGWAVAHILGRGKQLVSARSLQHQGIQAGDTLRVVETEPSRESRGGGVQQVMRLELPPMASDLHPRGLVNTGVTCYVNALVQCWCSTDPVRTWLASHPRCGKVCAMCAMQACSEALSSGEASPFTPTEVLEVLRQFPQADTEDGQMGDCMELHLHLLNLINRHLPAVGRRCPFRLTVGMMRTCTTCGMQDDVGMDDVGLSISLPCREVSIQQCVLETLRDPEPAEPSFCIGCLDNTASTLTTTVQEPPQALTIQIKRFDQTGKDNRRMDVSPVVFLPQGVNLTRYKLTGLIEHTENPAHFTAYTYTSAGWCRQSDRAVTMVTAARVMAAQAYMLFYKREGQRRAQQNNEHGVPQGVTHQQPEVQQAPTTPLTNAPPPMSPPMPAPIPTTQPVPTSTPTTTRRLSTQRTPTIQLAVAGAQGVTPHHVQQRVMSAAGPLAEHIHSVKLRTSKDQLVFHMITVSKRQGEHLVHRLNSICRSHGWYIFNPDVTRQRITEVTPRTKHDPKTIKAATLNLHSIRDKRVELQYYLTTSDVDIIALQETRLMPAELGGWPLVIPGYVGAGVPISAEVEGSVGIALMVRAGWIFAGLHVDSPFCVGANVAPRVGMQMIGVIAVYVPCRGRPNRTRALASIKATLAFWHTKYPGRMLMLLGDFNMKRDELSGWLQRNGGDGLKIQLPVGNRSTFRSLGGSEIDFIITSNLLDKLVRKTVVDSSWGRGDHLPVLSDIASPFVDHIDDDTVAANVKPRFKPMRQWVNQDAPFRQYAEDRYELVGAIVNSSSYAQVLAQSPEMDIEEVWNEFSKATAITADKQKLLQSADGKGEYRLKLPREGIQAIRRRNRLREQVDRGAGEKQDALNRLQREITRMLRGVRHDNWIGFVTRALADIRDSRELWSTIKRIIGSGKSKRQWQEMWDVANGAIASEPDDIKKVWWTHFTSMFTKTAVDHRWAPALRNCGPPATEALPGLVDAITWPAVMKGLQQLKTGTAPGGDCVPNEFYKLLLTAEAPLWGELNNLQGNLYEPSGAIRPSPTMSGRPMDDFTSMPSVGARAPCGDEPATPMGKLLLQILQQSFDDEMPAEWHRSLLVTLIKKDGDPTLTTSYRGIALMNSCLKLLCTIVLQGLERATMSKRIICREQAGFSKGEECVAQAVTLYDICQRRKQAGKSTVLTFIDFKAAFDTVSHEGMLYKLHHVGVRGPTLEFLRKLYKHSKVAVVYPDGTTSADIPVQQGVRQGCPLSPVLFKIFVNDLISFIGTHVKNAGVAVPGLPSRVIGLLFADDLVLLSENVEANQHCLASLGEYSDLNLLKINHAKCGALVVAPDVTTKARLKQQLEPPGTRLTQRGSVPIVTQYNYLGVMFDEDLSLDTMSNHRLGKATAALRMVTPLLSNSSLNPRLRMMVVRMIIMPIAMYGVELFGIHKQQTHKAQLLVNSAMRMVVGVSPSSAHLNLNTTRSEFNVPSLNAVRMQRISRLWRASSSKNTWIKLVVGSTKFNSRQSWHSNARRIHNKSTSLLLKADINEQSQEEMSDKEWARLVSRVINDAETVAAVKSTSGALRYHSWNLVSTRPQLKHVWMAGLSRGRQLLLKMRLNALVTDSMISRWKPEISPQCHWCKHGAEDYAHIVIHCESRRYERQCMIGSLIKQCEDLVRSKLGACSDELVLALLLGGEVYGRNSVLKLNHWEQIQPHGLVSTLQNSTTIDARADNAAVWEAQSPAARMAAFLQTTAQARRIGAAAKAARVSVTTPE